MGQSISIIQATLTLGYVIQGEEQQRETCIQRSASSFTSKKDVLLAHPEHYALTDTVPSSTEMASTRRADSGYGEDFHGEKVARDIAYIDEKYYRMQQDVKRGGERGGLLRMTRLTFSDANLDKPFYEINLSAKRLIKLSSNISHFTTLRRLDLSYNRLSRLPHAIKVLVNLEYLCISHNSFSEIPDCVASLPKLVEFDVSHNRVQDLTPCFHFAAKKLQTLKAGSNRLDCISVHVRNMVHLTTLDLSFNNIRVLPIELARLANLCRLQLDGCPLSIALEYSTTPEMPSLREICARIVFQSSVQFSNKLPNNLVRYLNSSNSCSSCHGPYFESHVRRFQWIERADRIVPFEHRLCSAHWSTEDDRILNLFADQISRDETSRRARAPPKDSSNVMTTVPLEQLQTEQQDHYSEGAVSRCGLRSKNKMVGDRCWRNQSFFTRKRNKS